MYGESKGHNVYVCTVTELQNLPSKVFLSGIYFCNTDIVQHHINNIDPTVHNLVPDCYEASYRSLLRRPINRCKFSEIDWSITADGIFVKPYKNDKEFDGTVVTAPSDYSDRGYDGPNPDAECYTSTVVKFLSEYRLLIGHGKLYGMGYMYGLFTEEMEVIRYL